MQIIFLSSEFGIINEWKSKHSIEHSVSCYDLETLKQELQNNESYVLIIDYDSVASDINKLISAGAIPNNTIVLERAPEIATGKMLLSHGVKAYGNARMQSVHYLQMLGTVIEGKVWTYPELTASLTKDSSKPSLHEDSITLIQNRLSPKEIEVVYYILDGLTNDAIASKLDITVRTIKAHVSSIYSKLHVSDRISLVLLLR
ncbi:LuxR C-terminal-related transcriptional regulator [Sulfurimonas sp.]|nr:LuxR C-terminal-related transcriptional regulator [Sulfurimonas sp.]